MKVESTRIELLHRLTFVGADSVNFTPLVPVVWWCVSNQNSESMIGVDVNKSDMIDLIADKCDISKSEATRALDAMLEGITAALKNGEQVALVGFGTFAVKDRAERQGRNPQTGATMVIKASRIPGFKPGKALKDAVN